MSHELSKYKMDSDNRLSSRTILCELASSLYPSRVAVTAIRFLKGYIYIAQGFRVPLVYCHLQWREWW